MEKEDLDLERYKVIVILARYNLGKSSVCTDKIFEFFGEEKVHYLTFTDQSKPHFEPRKTQIEFNELVKDKIIVFDEISDDLGREVGKYLRELAKYNKMIILSNPYGSSAEPKKEVELFKTHEGLGDCFIYVEER